jgi:hypothetical protein
MRLSGLIYRANDGGIKIAHRSFLLSGAGVGKLVSSVFVYLDIDNCLFHDCSGDGDAVVAVMWLGLKAGGGCVATLSWTSRQDHGSPGSPGYSYPTSTSYSPLPAMTTSSISAPMFT